MKAEEWRILDEVSEKLDPELRASLAWIIIKQDRLLWLFKACPEWKGSLEGLLWLNRYYKEQKREITKETLEKYGIPFGTNGFKWIIEWLEETDG